MVTNALCIVKQFHLYILYNLGKQRICYSILNPCNRMSHAVMKNNWDSCIRLQLLMLT